MPRSTRFFASIMAVFLLLVGISFTRVNASPTLPASDYALTGNFMAVKSTSATQASQRLQWQSLDAGIQTTGTLTSSEFKAPKRLRLQVSGFPNVPNIALLLERSGTGEYIRLVANDSGHQWQQHTWHIPNSWLGKMVRLKAIDASEVTNIWLGVSEPLGTHWLSEYHSGMGTIALWLRYTLHFLLFILPGIVIFKRWLYDRLSRPEVSVLYLIGIVSLIGYCIFWLYWVNHILGIVVSSLFLLGTLIEIYRTLRDRSLQTLIRLPDIFFPLCLIYLIGSLYLGILYLYSHPSEFSTWIANFRFFWPKPPDNVLPYQFADLLYFGQDPRPLWEGWQSSDRPPLQSGIVLIQRAFIGLIFPKTSVLSYQIIATISQCSWIAAVWALCRQLKLSYSQISTVLILCTSSGFFLFNSLFVWPKLLAAALSCTLFILVVQALQGVSKPTVFWAVSVGICTGLGLMAHSGVVFTIIPALMIMIVLVRKIGLRQVGLIVCTITLTITPWIGYQKLYEPPGNRLLKWHLAGVAEIDDRSFHRALIEEYQDLGLKASWSYKLDNFQHLFESQTAAKNYKIWPFYQAQRINEFFGIFFALSILNIGWLLMAINWTRRQMFNANISNKQQNLLFFLPALGILGLVTWCLLMFGPGHNVIIVHAGSYGTMLVLFVGLGVWLAKSPAWLKSVALAAQLVLFLIAWILPPPPLPLGVPLQNTVTLDKITNLYPRPNWFIGIYVLLFAGLIVMTLLRMVRLDSMPRISSRN
ncbi:MAG: hypothetical protein F6K00_23425 [Leptolyngbya sp. SIOISBB]|nr:hypothetical protein [Leptolyngbya sp. SIOISBB]